MNGPNKRLNPVFLKKAKAAPWPANNWPGGRPQRACKFHSTIHRAISSAPVDLRYHHTPMTEPSSQPTVVQDTEAPSPLAVSHQSHRPQLSQACRRLYGTVQHRGILAGLAILKLYCECLGTTWTGNSERDPIVFFRTADMADTSKWQRQPAEFDKDQAKAYSFTRPDHSPDSEF
jgi:hypothetical protein